jgi:Lar family restriction alleviation protein
MKEQELKPCPFCGDEHARIIGHTQNGHGAITAPIYIRCLGCGVTTLHHKTYDEVVAAWNCRVSSADESAAVSGLPSAVSSPHMESCPFVGMHETCPAHPSRCAPAGQWSEEVPSEKGWYWVGCAGCKVEDMSCVYVYEKDSELWVSDSQLEVSQWTVQEYCGHFSYLFGISLSWSKVIPPLPGGESEGKQ